MGERRTPRGMLAGIVAAWALTALPAAAAPGDTGSEATSRPLFAPKMVLCTGSAGNRYHRVGQRIAEAVEGHIRVEVATTGGSWENLERLEKGTCDAAIAQEDTFVVRRFEAERDARKVGKPPPEPIMHWTTSLYPEHVHLLCNKAVKASGLADLPLDTRIYLHRYGSGSFLSWRLFGTLEPRYAKLPASEVDLTVVIPRLARETTPACLFHVSGLGGRTLKTANEVYGADLRLLPVVDRKLHRPAGPQRRQIYTPSTMTARTWPGLLDGDLDTQTVDAVLFTSTEWRTRHAQAAAALDKVLIGVVAGLNEPEKR